jgi:hypothetical protein
MQPHMMAALAGAAVGLIGGLVVVYSEYGTSTVDFKIAFVCIFTALAAAVAAISLRLLARVLRR